jgi:hypothetical protein
VKEKQSVTFETVTVSFKADVRGTRTFPLRNRKSYRFDAGANRVHTMPREDAEQLFHLFGDKTFDFSPPLTRVR